MDYDIATIAVRQIEQSPTDEGHPLFEVVASLLSRALETFRRDINTAIQCVREAADLLSLRSDISVTAAVKTVGNGGLTSWQISRINHYLTASLEQSVRVAELAHITRLSRGHFHKAFRRSFGTSPQSFIRALRITHAKKLLLETKLPLSQIALACGLSNRAHLSRLFRRETGIPPNIWRRARQGAMGGASAASAAE